MERNDQKLFWLDLLMGATIALGVIGLIFFFHSQAANADAPKGSGGFSAGARLLPTQRGGNATATPPLPTATSAAPSSGPKAPARSTASTPYGGSPFGRGFFDDDEDDDDSVDDSRAQNPFGARKPHPALSSHRPKAFPTSGSREAISVGGSQNSGPDPVVTDEGVMVGGGNANGVISKNKSVPFSLNEETGEGSKAMITDFNYPDADITDLAKTMGKLTGKNFILDKDVKGKVTIISNSPIPISAAWKAFLTGLDINGFAIIPSGEFLRIARQRDARDKQLNTYTGEYTPDTDALITKVFVLKHLPSAEDVARTFRNFVPANARIIPFEQTGTILVTDTGSNISKLSKMLEMLDIKGSEAAIEVIPVKFASAVELSKLIDTLIPGSSASGGGGGGPAGLPRFGGGGASRFSARRTEEGGIINTIIADERTNNLIIHANAKGAEQVRELVAKLDQKLPSSIGGGKVHVVRLQFASAEQMANTLNNLSQGGGKAPSTPSSGGGGTGVNPVATSLFEGAIKISPDKDTNALVINASPADFATVKRVIDRLDVRRDQVFVEVVIMEVAISRNFDYSANLIMPKSGIGAITNTSDLTNFLTNPISQSGAIFGFAANGTTSYTIGGQTFDVGNIQGLIKLIQANTNSNILATPQIIALDNAEANFESAEKIPMNAGTTAIGAGLTQQNITKESVVLSISIKPQINKATNFVKMDVTTKLGDVQSANVPANLQGTTFGTLERTAKTTVVVGDSDSIVLGGLIRDKISDTVKKIPILGDIPILGWLFKSKSSSVQKSNLLIFMTPHIIRPYEKMRKILDKKLQQRDEFIEKNAGGSDPEREARDEMIRALPDVSEFNTAPQSDFEIDTESGQPGERPNEEQIEKRRREGRRLEKKAEDSKAKADQTSAPLASEPAAAAVPTSSISTPAPTEPAVAPAVSAPAAPVPPAEPAPASEGAE